MAHFSCRPQEHMRKDFVMKDKTNEAVVHSRRSMVTGSAALLLGGVAGGAGLAAAAAPQHAPAPPLPWKWTKLDPDEAGRRAYRSYLENKG